MLYRTLILLLGSVLLTGCIVWSYEEQVRIDAEKRAELQVRAEVYARQWQSLKTDSYNFWYQKGCFCSDDNVLREVRIYVENDVVKRVVYLDDGNDAPVQNYRTIDDWFDRIQVSETLKSVRYNPRLYYPASIYFDVDRITDSGTSIGIDDVQFE